MVQWEGLVSTLKKKAVKLQNWQEVLYSDEGLLDSQDGTGSSHIGYIYHLYANTFSVENADSDCSHFYIHSFVHSFFL